MQTLLLSVAKFLKFVTLYWFFPGKSATKVYILIFVRRRAPWLSMRVGIVQLASRLVRLRLSNVTLQLVLSGIHMSVHTNSAHTHTYMPLMQIHMKIIKVSITKAFSPSSPPGKCRKELNIEISRIITQLQYGEQLHQCTSRQKCPKKRW